MARHQNRWQGGSIKHCSGRKAPVRNETKHETYGQKQRLSVAGERKRSCKARNDGRDVFSEQSLNGWLDILENLKLEDTLDSDAKLGEHWKRGGKVFDD